jgi:hypothetical protein
MSLKSDIWRIGGNPSVLGLSAAVGERAEDTTTGLIWVKDDVGDTAWILGTTAYGGGVGGPGTAGPMGPPGISMDPDDPELPWMIPGNPGAPGAASTVPGPAGPVGLSGLDADDPEMPMVIQGPRGLQGIQGLQGLQGIDADDPELPLMLPGSAGPTGAASSVPGPAGPIGLMGPPGLDADDPELPMFVQGPKGATGGAGGGGSLTAATLACGATAKAVHKITVTDGTVTGTSKILVGWGTCLDTDTNGPDMDDVSFCARPAAGAFDVIVAVQGSTFIGGDVKINYMVAA